MTFTHDCNETQSQCIHITSGHLDDEHHNTFHEMLFSFSPPKPEARHRIKVQLNAFYEQPNVRTES